LTSVVCMAERVGRVGRFGGLEGWKLLASKINKLAVLEGMTVSAPVKTCGPVRVRP
jgi:hypothetical protein